MRSQGRRYGRRVLPHPRPLAGILALATFVMAGVGFWLRAEFAGIFMLSLAMPVAVLAWIALGSPIRRRDINSG